MKKTKKCTFLSFYYSKNKKRHIKNRKRCSKNKKDVEISNEISFFRLCSKNRLLKSTEIFENVI